jgi:hypothetical protein
VFDCCDRSGGITPPSLADFRGDLISQSFSALPLERMHRQSKPAQIGRG